MFENLQSLYEFNNVSRASALWRQLHKKIGRGESIVSFFMKIIELKDHLNALGDSINDKDLVMLAMNGLPHSWESFIHGISVRDVLPDLIVRELIVFKRNANSTQDKMVEI